MLKKIVINLLIGGAIYIFGVYLHDNRINGDIGIFLVYTGIGYAVISVAIILFNCKPLSFITKTLDERERNKALDELLKYKKLLDEGILSQDEFDKKSGELKKNIL